MGRIETTWYIVFTDEDVSPHWIHRFLKRGFHHCYCFRKVGRHIYQVNPRISNVDSSIYERYPVKMLARRIAAQPNTKVLKFKYPFDFNNRMFSLWNIAPTCVSVVKMFLGITARAQTPYQLYKQLTKLGAIEISTKIN